jgi:predicted phage terminase large subunit-like protein
MTSEREQRHKEYGQVLTGANKQGSDQVRAVMRDLCRQDLFFLIVNGMGRSDVDHDWLFDRCVEIQQSPNGYLDLWAREHYKSTIITFGLTIQDILNNPEITVGIFSHTKSIARSFLRQIKHELESNDRLKNLFPEILWKNPKTQATSWSEDKGITVKRKTNPNAATVEGNGLVDGMPTGKHYALLVYDDVVTRESVTTPEMIKKVTDCWALSLDLGAKGGAVRTIGTRYHFFDTYKVMMERGSVKPRVYPATKDGTVDGEPVFLTKESLAEKRRDKGPYIFACQQLQNPKADDSQGFDVDWIKYYTKKPSTEGMNIYMVVDPAMAKKKDSDYSVIFVVGLSNDGNYYVLDIVRDRINLTERTQIIFDLHREYRPNKVIYEKIGMQTDIQHIEYIQEEKNYRFNITEIGGNMPKHDRIKRLIPVFERGKIYFPKKLSKVDYEGTLQDLVKIFIETEYQPFPVMSHDDMLDCLARILDPNANVSFPMSQHGSFSQLPPPINWRVA